MTPIRWGAARRARHATGARITLDGHPIGATDGTFNTFPGPHVVIGGARGGPDDKYGYAGATPAGAALDIAAAAVCVAGVYLWRRTPASPGPTAAIAPGGGVVAGRAAAF